MAVREAEPHIPAESGAGDQAAAGAGDSIGEVCRFRAQDGLMLAMRVFPAASDRIPLLCLPGLSRNSRDFTALGRYFSQHPSEPRTVVAVDYRGRGLSEWDRDWRNYKPLLEAQDLLTAAAVLGIHQAVLVGTSRGGIISMLLGALRPALLAGVVLNDIGPVIEGTGLARIKNYLSAPRPAADWDEAVARLRDTAEGAFPALDDDDWRAYAASFFAESASGLVPQYDPRLVRTIADVDFTEKIPPLWPQYASLARVPLLAIRGELSDILSEPTLKAMGERHPDFESLVVPGQGHAPLLRDKPTLDRIMTFAEYCAAADGAWHNPCRHLLRPAG